jgi:5'-3' exonuclease
MGIKNLHKFLQKHAPQVYSEKHLSEYSGLKIAIDITLYLYKFKTTFRGKWVNAFLNMIALLKKFNIQGIFIYDTKAPEMKSAKIQERRLKRINAENRIKAINKAVDDFKNQGESDDTVILTQIMDKHSDKAMTLLRPTNPIAIPINLDVIQLEISRLEKQIVYISRWDIQTTKEILDILGMVHFDSPNEAETMASHLCCHKIVDAVLSNDTDVLTYGTPLFLSNLSRETVTEMRVENILDAIKMSQAQFIDLCIMCGTDYNNNIFRIGSEKAYGLLTSFGSIEEIRDNTKIDVSILEHVQVRELFLVPTEMEKFDLTESPVDMDKLEIFLVTHNCSPEFLNTLVVKNEI